MEDIQRHRGSRKGYRSHLTRLFANSDELLNTVTTDLTEETRIKTSTALESLIHQFNRKEKLLTDLDAKILSLIENEDELETEVLETEEVQCKITETVGNIKSFIKTYLQNSIQQPTHSEQPRSKLLDSQPTLATNSEATGDTESNLSMTLETGASLPAPVRDSSSTDKEAAVTLHTLQDKSIASDTGATRQDRSIAPGKGATNSEGGIAIRLPKLTISVFGGDPLDWQPFWDSYEAAIHNNSQLTGAQKLTYLRAQLRGDAAQVIAGLPLTSSSYQHSVEVLQKRFGQNHLLVSSHIQALIDLSTPTDTLEGLRRFHDLIESHIRSLASLGKKTDSYSAMLVPFLLRKLPVNTIRNIARARENSDWTIEELQAALLKEIRIFETSLHSVIPRRSKSSEGASTLPTAAFHANVKGTSTNHSQRPSCSYCKNTTHNSSNCDTIKTQQARVDFIKQNNLCFNCLGHHRVSRCTSKTRCRLCRRKHHTSLCTNNTDDSASRASSQTAPRGTLQSPATTNPTSNPPTMNPSANNSNPAQNTPPVASLTISTTATLQSIQLTKEPICLLKTAVATVAHEGTQVDANILFDEGSQRSFATQILIDKLRLQPHQTELIQLSTFGSPNPQVKKLNVASLQVITKSGTPISITVLIVPSIATPLENTVETSCLTDLPHLKGLQLAHPVTRSDSFEISLLIGANHYWDFVGDHTVRGNGPTAISSKLGYLLSGPLSITNPQQPRNITNLMCMITNSRQEEEELQHMWSVESIGISQSTPLDPDEQFFQNYSSTAISRCADGSYMARLPWKEQHPPLPTNFNISQKRTTSLVRRLAQTPHMLSTYDAIISDQLKRGFIERVQASNTSTGVHYIPHHAVRKDSVTTPIRIVFDCSCSESRSSASLNDCLEPGPTLLNDLCSIILRFRLHNYGFATDIEKAFLQIKLHHNDRDYARFLWLSDTSNPNSELITYRFQAVLFGATSSPFILNAVLRHHLQQYQTTVADDITQNLYVDNIISGCSSAEAATQYYQQARQIMKEANFNLRSWASNSSVLNTLAAQDATADPNTTVNILGIQWSTHDDQLHLTPSKLANINNLVTKREVLQQSCKVFNPIGLATPVTIRAKMLIQRLWKESVDWDEPLSDILCQEWSSIFTDLVSVSELAIPRQYYSCESKMTNAELHLFCDANIKAYGTIAFFRQKDETTFVMARGRVAPLKPLTVPQLELLGALTATRLSDYLQTSFTRHKFKSHFWTDSQIVLYWIQGNKKLKPFVQHRVSEIQLITQKYDATWHYCPTADNPADMITRGSSTSQLSSSLLWNKGPPWLTNDSNWPQWTPSSTFHLHVAAITCEEFIPAAPQPLSSSPTISLHNIIDPNNYSSLGKLLRVSAYVYRFITAIRKHNDCQCEQLTATEIDLARIQWIKNSQYQIYATEISNLNSPNSSNKQSTLVRQLRLFIDSNGLLRCGGRIHNAPLTQLAKFPYLLPPKHPFTALVVYAAHVKLYHSGVGTTVTALRQSYWIPRARQYVRSLLRRCVICRKHSGKPYTAPDPAPLPKARLQNVQPFSVTGVDFTGALYVYNRGEEIKVYVCLFTCATSRAVHLEVVADLSTETFILAFRRFTGRRSTPHLMISDNATTFQAAAEELKALYLSQEIRTVLSHEGVTWKFIPKKAPWFGGFWERLIGLTKSAIKKVLGRAHISLEVLQTIVVEVEALMNDRPLTYVSDDPKDPEPLTPSHLLSGRRITSLPHEQRTMDEVSDPSYNEHDRLSKDAKTQGLLLQHFTTRWRNEYLTSLREFHRTSGSNECKIAVGDVVLVHDDGPRVKWRLAVVEELTYGGDGLVRAANIRTSTGQTNRPIVRLVPLEVSAQGKDTVCSKDNKLDCEVEKTSSTSNSQVDIPEEVIETRPTRSSASKARERLTQWANILSGAPEDVIDS